MHTHTTTFRPRALGSLLLGLSLSTVASAPLLADDTEIYVGANNGLTSVKSNMLVIIDTSGSMASEMVTQGDYDPDRVYSGCFDTGRVYWSTNTPSTDCRTSRWFEASYNRCAASIASMGSSGFFQGKLARFSSGAWRGLTTNSRRKNSDVECLSDAGVHGRTAGDSAVWASNGGSGWSASESAQLNWANSGQTYTLYSGNFMNYMGGNPDVLRTRLEIIQDVIADLVDSTNVVNIGLMRFDTRGEGGMVTYAMQDVVADRNNFKAEMYSYWPGGNTPLSETLYEATLYHRAGEVDYGDSSSPSHSAGEARQNANPKFYLSPIKYQCQKSNIVLLTDGIPVADSSADDKIVALPNFAAATGSASCLDEHGGPDGQCLDELAAYLQNTDQAPHLAGDQRVTTYTVGFAFDHPLLKDTAKRGGGSYHIAADAVELTKAFTNIVNEILAQDTTFSAPAVAVNAFNRTTHRDSLYFTLFKPDTRPHWNGNLKKYTLGYVTDATTGEVIAQVQDSAGRPAIDAATGYFKDSSSSYWKVAGAKPDGSDVNKGGAAARLTTTRKVYTYTGSSHSNLNLANTAHALHEDNSAITEALLGLPVGATNPSREELLQWARGLDIDGDFGEAGGARPVLGDPLHSRATAVQYGGTDADPDLTIFFSTNDGFVHAIDEDTGDELFAFIPQELLDNLPTLYAGTPGTPRPYGLDGSLVSWMDDRNENGIVDVNDHVYLYGGMRRGGHSYYALDVTNRSQPKLLWRISNDSDDDGTPDGDFAELGQTWSDPVLGKIKHNGAEKTVLIFGGGYDPAQDANIVAQDDVMGRAIYIVDAETGARLWWAGPANSGADLILNDMTNSIPSSVNALDIDSDGFVDRIYVGDMRAQLWRIDVNNDNSGAADLASGGRIWALGDNTAAGNRRFYYPPDVALSGGFPGVGPHLTILIGSGYRAHPLNEAVNDRIYLLRDGDIFAAPASYAAQSEADLYDATANTIGEGTDLERQTALDSLASAHGWYVQLTNAGVLEGEKVLASPLILNNTAIITTFVPEEDTGIADVNDVCAPRAGKGAVYYMNLNDARPVDNFDGIGSDSDLTASDRKLDLARSGIPPSPALVISTQEETLLVGPEVVPDPINTKAVRTYWHDR